MARSMWSSRTSGRRSGLPKSGGTLTRRDCLGGIAMLGLLSGCGMSPGAGSSLTSNPPATPAKKSGGASGMPPLATFTPEGFGAAGDGSTNDTDAFAAMTAAVNAEEGGTIVLRKGATYIVGKQVPDPTLLYAYRPVPIIELDGCSKPLRIIGNGACLKCADGLKFGTFDPATGLPTHHAMPYTGAGELASPYFGMINVQNCTDKIQIENIELDGNLAKLVIGGQYGDVGWQIPSSGIRLVNNSYGEHLVGIHTHHHALDGLMIDGVEGRATGSVVENVVSEYNARQGCSLVGGCNYSFSDCKFNHTGKAGLVSSPGAGFDIEAELKTIRNVTFSGCEFSNNSGVGMGADSGDSSGVTFDNCRFIGTTNWSAWPRKPYIKFSDCQFVGAVVCTFSDPDPARATQFYRCTFVDDPALSPTGEIYASSGTIADLGGGDQNVLFDSCRFELKHDVVLPWTVQSIYNNCVMSQTSSRQAYPRGTYKGVDTIQGNVDLYSARIVGQLTVNGAIVAPN